MSLLAEHYTIGAHDGVGQVRKYSREPYWHHCRRVAQHSQKFVSGDSAHQAAWLHDVVEDTKITLEMLETHFGKTITNLVYWLTNDKQGTRKERKAREVEKFLTAPKDAKLIKLCDIYDNACDFNKYDPSYLNNVWGPEKIVLMESLKGVNDNLWSKVRGSLKPTQMSTGELHCFPGV